VYVGKDENLTLTHSYSCLIYDFTSSLEQVEFANFATLFEKSKLHI